MRVKLQLVLCSDEGQEETVTDVITLNKHSDVAILSRTHGDKDIIPHTRCVR